MPKDARGFLDGLRESRLLDADQLQTIERACAKARKTPDAKAVAAHLIKLGWITRWQADELLIGNSNFWLKHYKLIEPLGEGTTSQVFLAENVGLRKTVVLKLLHDELLDDPKILERFRREIEAVASIRHPNFVLALDAGKSDDTYFLVTEYAPGRDLGAIVSETGPMPVDVACECARQVAVGLDHLTSLGLLHRDMKPRNLLLTREGLDGPPVIKILDLGATRLQAGMSGASLTKTGDFVGTPDFIAPEQILDGKAVDCRADIFGLGATLYYLLTGSAPIEGKSILERLNYRLNQPTPHVSQVRSDVPAELDAILARMLACDADERYATPAEVAAALVPFAKTEVESAFEPIDPSDHLNISADASSVLLKFMPPIETTEPSKPVAKDWGEFVLPSDEGSVKSPSSATRTVALAEPAPPRRWLPLAVIAVVVFFSIGAVAWNVLNSALIEIDWPVDDRNGAEIKLDGDDRTLSADSVQRISVAAGRHRLLLRREGYEPVSLKFTLARGEQYPVKPQWRALVETQRQTMNNLVDGSQSLDASDPKLATIAKVIRSYGSDYLSSDPLAPIFVGELLAKLPNELDKLTKLSLPNADPPITADADVVAALGSVPPRMGHWMTVDQLAYGPNGRHLFSCGMDGVAKQWEASTGELVRTYAPAAAMQLSPDGGLLASNHQGMVNIWDVNTGELLPRWGVHRGGVRKMSFTGDGKHFIIESLDDEISGYNTQTAERTFSLEGYTTFTRHPDDSRVILVSAAGAVQYCNPATGKLEDASFSFQRGPADLNLTPDGKHLAITLRRGALLSRFEIGVWKRQVLSAPEDIHEFCFTPNGETLCTAHGNVIRLWNVPQNQEIRHKVISALTRCSAIAATDDRVAVGDHAGYIRQFDLKSLDELPVSERLLDSSVRCFAINAANGSLVLGLDDQKIVLWNPITDRRTTLERSNFSVFSVAACGATNQIAAVGYRTPVRFWDGTSGSFLFELTLESSELVVALAISPDGRFLALALRDNTIQLWNMEEKRLTVAMQWKGHNATSFGFSPNGQYLTVAGHASSVPVWSVPSGQLLHEFSHEPTGHRACFSADSKQLHVNSGRTLTTWDLGNGNRRNVESIVETRPPVLSFDSTGQYRAMAGTDGKVRLMTLKKTTAPRELVVGPANGLINDIAFFPDGRYLASLNGNGSVYVYRVREFETEPKPALATESP